MYQLCKSSIWKTKYPTVTLDFYFHKLKKKIYVEITIFEDSWPLLFKRITYLKTSGISIEIYWTNFFWTIALLQFWTHSQTTPTCYMSMTWLHSPVVGSPSTDVSVLEQVGAAEESEDFPSCPVVETCHSATNRSLRSHFQCEFSLTNY